MRMLSKHGGPMLCTAVFRLVVQKLQDKNPHMRALLVWTLN